MPNKKIEIEMYAIWNLKSHAYYVAKRKFSEDSIKNNPYKHKGNVLHFRAFRLQCNTELPSFYST